ncbi:hypothetical protein L484_009291 [Morus notabilis]|uniref:Uncharacterized protein n=1 Tax=Morus notabilis TaxID=981085 RepID=W9R6S3_9ROSA|nr:hypothetical protein L484_009291 [Morus notabilis]
MTGFGITCQTTGYSLANCGLLQRNLLDYGPKSSRLWSVSRGSSVASSRKHVGRPPETTLQAVGDLTSGRWTHAKRSPEFHCRLLETHRRGRSETVNIL